MASTLNKIGILTFAANNDNGVLNYTKSLIDALKNDSTNKYILFCNHNDDRYDNYDLEIRKLCKSNNYLIKRIIYLIQFIFFIRKPYMLTKDEINLFHDINFFISPAVSAYPHYFLNKPFCILLFMICKRNIIHIILHYMRDLSGGLITKHY